MPEGLEIGGSFSRYRVVSKIGEGGMGEVYLAEDTELGRQVALKVLLSEVAGDEDRVRRFVQEAKAASALNHPNILTVYEIGTFDESRFIATELIKGQTLRDRLRGEPMTLREVLDVAMQTAAALNAAHSAGIVHRDIKPENIMLRDDGIVKVLDFGLAKLAVDPNATADSEEATRAQVNTRPGVIMGTVQYMSPEQARGRETDARCDIWSLGVVMYEMLTKRTPFAGETANDSIAAILTKDPPPLDAATPSELQRIIKKTLQKNADERYQTVKDLLLDVKNLKRELEISDELERSQMPHATGSANVGTAQLSEHATAIHSGVISTQNRMPQQLSSAEYIVSEIKRHKTGLIGGLLLVVALVGAGGYAVYHFSNREKPSTAPGQLKISRLVTGLGNIGDASISPDGKYVAYELDKDGKASLHVRQVSTGSDREIVAPVEDSSFTATVFSPDGESVYYNFRQREKSPLGTLYQVPVIGGREPKKILEHISDIIGFAPDGKRFAFQRDDLKSGDSFLMIGNLDGGEPREIAKRSGNDWFLGIPAWSPDGRVIVCPVGTDTGGTQYSLVEVPVDGGPERRITPYSWHGVVWRPFWLKDGSGLVVNAQDHISDPVQIWNVSYPGGAVTRITNDLTQYGTTSFGLTADSSTIISIAAESSAQIWLAAPNEDEARARKLSSGSSDGSSGLDWTPDGRIVYTAQTGDTFDIWSMSADGSGRKQLTSNEDFESNPTVSPDGRYILFTSDRGGIPHIWRMDIDGGNPKQLTQGGFEDYTPICSADSNTVVFLSWRSGTNRLWKIPINGGEPVQVSDLPFQGSGFLPDGKLMFGSYFDDQVSPPRSRPALLSFETGQLVKVFDLPKKAGVAWGMTDEHTFIYQEQRDGVDNLWTVPVDGSTPKQLTKFTSQNIFGFKLSRDGKRIAIARGTASSDIILIKGFH